MERSTLYAPRSTLHIMSNEQSGSTLEAAMAELWQTLQQLFLVLGTLIYDLGRVLLPWSLGIVWVAWWLWAVDWRRLWPTLAEGAWAPLVLLGVAGAMAWAMIAPAPLLLGTWQVDNFWWQLSGVGLVIGAALFCGWLQTHFRWFPLEIEFDTHHAHDHHNAHATHDGHAHDGHAHGEPSPHASGPPHHPHDAGHHSH